jgi:OOP family OmpA-OmpF porin
MTMTRTIPLAPALLGAVLLLAGAAAHADENWFMGASAGTSNYKGHATRVCDRGLNHSSLTGTCNAAKGSVPVHIYGGYNLSELWGVEAGITMLGNSSYTATVTAPEDATITGTVKTTAYTGDLFARFYPVSRCTIAVKVGGYYASNRITSTATGKGSTDDISHSASNAGLLVGLGAAYELTRHVSATLDIDQYKAVGEQPTSDQSNVTLLQLGLRYSFR